jgi:hypothetical protein
MKVCLLALAIVLFTGCTLKPEPVETKSNDAQEIVNSLEYVKAKNGLCFGVSTVMKMSTNMSFSNNVVVVSVDCAKVGL